MDSVGQSNVSQYCSKCRDRIYERESSTSRTIALTGANKSTVATTTSKVLMNNIIEFSANGSVGSDFGVD
jgi:hypothetical protein